jgi:hypothetical protein
MDDAFGRIVKQTPEAIAQREADQKAIEAWEAAEAKAAARAEKKHLAQCKRQGIPADDCPPLSVEEYKEQDAHSES